MWINFIPDRYDLIVEVCNFLDWWHHIMKALHVSTERGHEKVLQQAASKHEKVLRAEEYFSHVDFAIEELMSE